MIAAAKPLSLTKATSMVRPTQAIRRAAVVVRAVESPAAVQEEEQAMPATYTYGGQTYSEAEWKDAVYSGKLAMPAPAPAAAAAMGLEELMSFAGPAPELINGRLSMLAFVAAVGAELSSGESVVGQLAQEPTLIALTFVLFSVASLIPMLSGAKREAFGPFSPDAEMLNGRAAMLGFATLLVVEGLRGAALF